MADLLVASNRGPVSFTRDATGALTPVRGGGGLVSALSSATRHSSLVWVCAALSEADRDAAAPGRGRIEGVFDAPLQLVDIAPQTYHRAYNQVANSVLWFVNHLLYATPTAPVFDAAFRRDWAGYVEYNQQFARAIAGQADPGARVLVQDYHLFLVPGLLRAARPDLLIGHFTHTPWAPPDYFAMLPDEVGRAVVEGIHGANHAGFLTDRWADAFACCAKRFGAQEVDGGLKLGDRVTSLAAHPLGVDAPELRARAAQPDVEQRLAALRAWAKDRQVVVRIDRTELSKNLVRGLQAFRELLITHPEWREKVVHVAFAYPSRTDLAEYREYTAAVHRTARSINEEFSVGSWEPVRLEVNDDYARSLAAMRLADVLVVNPIRDGMNLVAKEGPVISDHGLALVLSREAGAAAELGQDALLVNPYDVSETAAAIHAGLAMDPAKRAWRSHRLARHAAALPPKKWLHEQLSALG